MIILIISHAVFSRVISRAAVSVFTCSGFMLKVTSGMMMMSHRTAAPLQRRRDKKMGAEGSLIRFFSPRKALEASRLVEVKVIY